MLVLILCILQLSIKSDNTRPVILTLLKMHQAIEPYFEAENETEMSHDITRVNWAIITILIS